MTTQDRDFLQFEGTLADPVTPPANLRERLRLALDPAADATQPGKPRHLDAEPSVSREVDVPARTARVEPVSRPSWRRRLDHVGAAAMILLALTVIASSLMLLAPGSNSRLGRQVPSHIDDGNFNGGGNAGRTEVISDTAPHITDVRKDQALPWTANEMYLLPTIIVGNYLIYLTGTDTESWLVNYDLSEHAVVWKIPGYFRGSLAGDGERVYLMPLDQKLINSVHVEQGSTRMTAINLTSGDVEWQGPEITLGGTPVATVLLAGDIVYGLDSLGNVQALDKVSGALMWQYPDQPNGPVATPQVANDDVNSVFIPSLAANAHALYATQPDRTVVALDRITGGERGTIDTEEVVGGEVQHVVLSGNR